MRPDTVFSVADIMNSSCVDGEVRVNLGAADTGEGIATECAVYGQDGFVSRPNDSTADGAAQALYSWEGNQKRVMATRDNRWVSHGGNLEPGDRAVVTNGPARIVVKQSGAVTLMTSDDGTSTGNGVYLRVAPDKLSFVAPWGKLTFDATGLHITTASGARLDLGSVNLPGPLAALAPNYARITASTVTIDSPTVMIGPSLSNGGTGIYMSAAYSVLPPVAPGIPILGAGVGAVVVAAAGSTGVWIGI